MLADPRIIVSSRPRAQQPVGEDMATLRVGAELRLVDADEGNVAFDRQGFHRAEQVARVGRRDPLFAGDRARLAPRP